MAKASEARPNREGRTPVLHTVHIAMEERTRTSSLFSINLISGQFKCLVIFLFLYLEICHTGSRIWLALKWWMMHTVDRKKVEVPEV